MLWIKVKADEPIDVLDTQGNHLGVLTAHQRGYGVRIGFQGMKNLVFKRRGVAEPQPAQPRKPR